MGNQPFRTRSCCWYSSRMLQKLEKATTPRMMLAYSFGTNNEATRAAMPASRNAGQHCLPKWYSLLMTSGWKTPMVRNVARPMMSPIQFIRPPPCSPLRGECRMVREAFYFKG